jgi:hypothetical protein
MRNFGHTFWYYIQFETESFQLVFKNALSTFQGALSTYNILTLPEMNTIVFWVAFEIHINIYTLWVKIGLTW